MKEVIRDVLSFNERSWKVPMLIYESVAEADKAAGREGACLNECNTNLIYRGCQADARELLADIVQELTSVKPLEQPVKDKKDAKGNQIMEVVENEAKYVVRALSSPGCKATFEDVQAIIDKRARGYKDKDGKEYGPLAVDITVKVREPRIKKLAQKFKDVALEFLSGKKSLEKFEAAMAKAGLATKFEPVKGKKMDDPENIEKLGWMCKAFQDAQDAFKNM